MKKIVLGLVLALLLSGNAYSMEMSSIQKYLSDKKPNDYPATIYSMIRCSALNQYISLIILSAGKKSSTENKFDKRSEKFALVASQLDSKISGGDFKKSATMVFDARSKTFDLYLKDGEENWIRTGSKFSDSYIDEDRLFCEDLYLNVYQTPKK